MSSFSKVSRFVILKSAWDRFNFLNYLCRKDSVLKPQFINELNLPVGDSEDDFSSSEEELEQDQDELANSDESVEALESAQSSSWCAIL